MHSTYSVLIIYNHKKPCVFPREKSFCQLIIFLKTIYVLLTTRWSVMPTGSCSHSSAFNKAFSPSIIISSEWPLPSVFYQLFKTFSCSPDFSRCHWPAVGLLLLCSERSPCRFHKRLGTAVPPHVSAMSWPLSSLCAVEVKSQGGLQQG